LARNSEWDGWGISRGKRLQRLLISLAYLLAKNILFSSLPMILWVLKAHIHGRNPLKLRAFRDFLWGVVFAVFFA
jgi:hypothetical protein